MTIYNNFYTNELTIGSTVIVFPPQQSITQGIFEGVFLSMEKSSIKNNLSEEEAMNLIDSIRDELPMNQ